MRKNRVLDDRYCDRHNLECARIGSLMIDIVTEIISNAQEFLDDRYCIDVTDIISIIPPVHISKFDCVWGTLQIPQSTNKGQSNKKEQEIYDLVRTSYSDDITPLPL